MTCNDLHPNLTMEKLPAICYCSSARPVSTVTELSRTFAAPSERRIFFSSPLSMRKSAVPSRTAQTIGA